METTAIKVAVRHLVGYAFQSGDLGHPAFASRDRLAEGSQGHRLLQNRRPHGYQTEVPVSLSVEEGKLVLEISGRIDGLLKRDNVVLVEEIKTTYVRLDEQQPENVLHWAQAKVYAHIVATQTSLDSIDVQLTYLHMETWQTQEDRQRFRAVELREFFSDLVSHYVRWPQSYRAWCTLRNTSIAALDFPHPSYRPGQRKLVQATQQAIAGQQRLFAQGPTGIGKTTSVLFPAIKAIGDGRIEKIFYLTPRTTGRIAAEKALDEMRGGGLRIRSLTLTARDRICFKPVGTDHCDVEDCEFALGYYDRINDALADILQTEAITHHVVEEIARTHRVCPFELSLDISPWVDVIICDYNYVFDPRVFLRRFFQDRRGMFTFLVDEAHNLVERARDMFSAHIDREQTRSLLATTAANADLCQCIEDFGNYFAAIENHCSSSANAQSWADRELPTDLAPLLERCLHETDRCLKRPGPETTTDLLDFYFTLSNLLRVVRHFDEHHVIYAEKSSHDLRLHLYCVDPSRQLREALGRGNSAVLFSATLTPLEYFRDLLGGEENDPLLSLPSVFSFNNLQVLVADHIATTYRQRRSSVDEVASAIAALSSQRQGNYLVFFPSHRYLADVSEHFNTAFPEIPTLLQKSRMSEVQREKFLGAFTTDRRQTLVGFAVMGGIFGEGIDLVGERLVGTVVVGVGLPQICVERDLIRDHFHDRGQPGFDYAYTYPGFNRVLQAAGRVIRSEEDRGIILLIDKRFSQKRYRHLFPTAWNSLIKVADQASIKAAAKRFWHELTPG